MDDKTYMDCDGNACTLLSLCRKEPEWAASRIKSLTNENKELKEQVEKMSLVYDLFKSRPCDDEPEESEPFI